MKPVMSYKEIVEDLRKDIFEIWSEEDKTNFFLTEYNEKQLEDYHHSLGRYIRNTYRLWEVKWEPELRDGVDYSPYHPDSVSMTIIKEVWKQGLPKKDEL